MNGIGSEPPNAEDNAPTSPWTIRPPEERYRLETADKLSADKLFERRWALTLLERALARLRDDFAAAILQQIGGGLCFDEFYTEHNLPFIYWFFCQSKFF
jgi:hypothetical protein